MGVSTTRIWRPVALRTAGGSVIDASLVLCVAIALVCAACGGSSGGPTGGTASGQPTAPTTPAAPPANAVNTTIITIANNAVSPKNIIVPRGSQVAFVNNDNQPHDMNSDPHPQHTDCPAINVGFLVPGQQRQSAPLLDIRTCGFHDHNQDTVEGLKGTITIQ